jgi:hypothetical protein
MFEVRKKSFVRLWKRRGVNNYPLSKIKTKANQVTLADWKGLGGITGNAFGQPLSSIVMPIG